MNQLELDEKAQAGEVEMEPVEGKPVEVDYRVMINGFPKAGTHLIDRALHDFRSRVQIRRRPLMEALRTGVLPRKVHGIGNEGSVAKPAVPVCGEVGARRIGSARTLILQYDLDALLKKGIHVTVSLLS